MTTERSEAGHCSGCHYLMTGKDWQLAHKVDGKVLCDDCFDEAMDAEEEDE